MKRIAIFAVLAALLGTSIQALAAGPQAEAAKPEAQGLYEKFFNASGLEHRF